MGANTDSIKLQKVIRNFATKKTKLNGGIMRNFCFNRCLKG